MLQLAIEREFGGFVTVFVSSDGGRSIPAGANFLTAIDDALVNCVAAIYLISPASQARPWINFELGAIWSRDAVNRRANNAPVPTIPLCHSGASPATLPQPLGSLNGVIAADAAQLKNAFRALQGALGVQNGSLHTDFTALANDIAEFERKYTVGDSLKQLFKLVRASDENLTALVDLAHKNVHNSAWIDVNLGSMPDEIYTKLLEFQNGPLAGIVTVIGKQPGMFFSETASFNGRMITLKVDAKSIIDNAAELLA
ncbi:hypothetical protein TK49_06765 [Ralstonia mannitolilytica]|nr:hypothetical protein TK49_06765 [Ralstonia mannitolilytica]